MKFEVFLSNKAEKGLKKSETKMRNQLNVLLDKFEINPVPLEEYDVIKLSSSKFNYRVRISNYRILYTVIWEESEVRVYSIGKRTGRTYK